MDECSQLLKLFLLGFILFRKIDGGIFQVFYKSFQDRSIKG
jgi:hypothetical protein